MVREQSPICIDIWNELPDDEKKEFEAALQKNENCPLYILVCFQETLIDRQRVDWTDQCQASNTHTYAKWCEGVCARVTIRKPPEPNDEPCEMCCQPFTPYDNEDLRRCLWLARIDNFKPYKEVQPEEIHNEIRRKLSTYAPTVITGVNWLHGATYSESVAQYLISERHGLRVRFSRPVLRRFDPTRHCRPLANNTLESFSWRHFRFADHP